MSSRSALKTWYPLLVIAGEALIVLAFHLITEMTGRGPVAWLNLAVCMLVFLVVAGFPLLIAISPGQFSPYVPAIGILWFLDIAYGLASGTIIWAGHSGRLDFRYQLLMHLGALLSVLAVIAAASHASEHSQAVAAREGGLLVDIDTMRGALRSLAQLASVLPPLEEAAKLLQLCAEDARYLAPSPNPAARQLEMQILQAADDIDRRIRNASLPGLDGTALRREVLERASEMQFLLRQRKSCGAN